MSSVSYTRQIARNALATKAWHGAAGGADALQAAHLMTAPLMRRTNNFVCLAGNARIALISCHRRSGDELLNETHVASNQIQRSQNMDMSDSGVCGDIGSSDPLEGSDITHAIPRWSARLFFDALRYVVHLFVETNTLPATARMIAS